MGSQVSPNLVTDICIYEGVMFITAMAMLFCPSTTKEGGMAHPEGSKGKHGGKLEAAMRSHGQLGYCLKLRGCPTL